MFHRGSQIKFETLEFINMMKKLESLPFTLYLTGSRYFGTYNSKSDWDFFCEYNNHTALALKQLGFNESIQGIARYKDAECQLVLRWISTNGDQIDIQLVRNPKIKFLAQGLFLSDYPGGRMVSPTPTDWRDYYSKARQAINVLSEFQEE